MNQQSLAADHPSSNTRLGSHLLGHLQREAKLLDGLIAAAGRIRDFLRQSTLADTTLKPDNHASGGQPDRNGAAVSATASLDQARRSFIDLQTQLKQTFVRLHEARTALQKELSQLPVTRDAPLSIREFAGNLDQQLGESLLAAWKSVKQKRTQFETIQAGNQVVLFYSIDHNRRLLSVFLPSKMNDGYDAMGNNRSDVDNGAEILRTHC